MTPTFRELVLRARRPRSMRKWNVLLFWILEWYFAGIDADAVKAFGMVADMTLIYLILKTVSIRRRHGRMILNRQRRSRH